jgi:hypothetical protein
VAKFGKLSILVNDAAFQEHVDDLPGLTGEHFNRALKAKKRDRHEGAVTGLSESESLFGYSMTKGGIQCSRPSYCC